jgi:translation initiation factor IF-2
VVSIRKQKDQINEAREGQECGIIFEPQKDFQVRDKLTAIKA